VRHVGRAIPIIVVLLKKESGWEGNARYEVAVGDGRRSCLSGRDSFPQSASESTLDC